MEELIKEAQADAFDEQDAEASLDDADAEVSGE